MKGVPARLRKAVVARAAHRCEYCGLSQIGQEATFHVDHIHPQADGGPTKLENLALACVSCSLRKGARRVATDPTSNRLVPLFNPRQQSWPNHFEWAGVLLKAKTAIARATVSALDLNRESFLRIRAEAIVYGRHPPTN